MRLGMLTHSAPATETDRCPGAEAVTLPALVCLVAPEEIKLVDKMLALAPKLRAAKSDSERATLQNAVTATDRQIDALVYELYGLTEDEIRIVEGEAKG